MKLSPAAVTALAAAAGALLAACPARPTPSSAAGARAPARPGRAPDFNGDGFADLAIGAPGEQSEEIGQVFVYLGGAAGWRPAPSATLGGPDVVGASFGTELAVADFDGDGLADLAVGAPGQDDFTGKVYIYRGGARGLQATPSGVLTGTMGARGWFGASLGAAGDVNGDGFADLVVGAPGEAGGRAHLFLGSASGPAARASATYFGDAAQAGRFGDAVCGAGDVNGDRFADLLVGAPLVQALAGAAYLFAGAAEGLSPVPLLALAGKAGAGEQLATRVTGAGDLNGDGFADVLLATPHAANGRGGVRVHRGARGGLSAEPAAVIESPDEDEGSEDAQLGFAIAAAGDVDGDGLPDFVAGANRYRTWTGRVHFYRGGRGVQPSRPARSWTGPAGTYAGFGAALAGAGDADGDGFTEIVASAPGARRVYVFAGGAGGPSAEPTLVIPAPAGSPRAFGDALAVTPTR